MTIVLNSKPSTINNNNNNNKNYADSNSTHLSTSSELLQPSEYEIRVLGIAEQGAKSRVETQIRLCLELVDSIHGHKVTNKWSHIRLPDTMLTLKRRNNAILHNNSINNTATAMPISKKRSTSIHMNEPSLPKDESSVLYLHASVICESDVHRKVKMCHRCVWREWKRADRKKAGKRLGNMLYDETMMEQERQRILLFNSDPLISFSEGECILPTRITCYSRHHDERLGFRIKFTLSDYQGKVVAKGDTPPVMITDDHKNLSKLGDKRRRRKRRKSSTETIIKKETLPTPEEDSLTTFEESNNSPPPPTPSHVSSLNNGNNINQQQQSSSSLFLNQDFITPTVTNNEENNSYYLDPSLFLSTHSSTTSTTNTSLQDFPLLIPSLWPSPSSPSFTSTTELSSPLSSSPSSPITSSHPSSFLISPELQQHYQQQQHSLQSLYDIESLTMLPPPITSYSNSSTSSSSSSSITPIIEKIIPDHAPMTGGTEITILGSNFQKGMTCYFGDQPALTTTYWSPSTLVCVVPPSNHQLGPVFITLGNNNNNQHHDSFVTCLSSTPILFTYDSTNTTTTNTTASITNEKGITDNGNESSSTSSSLDNMVASHLSSLLTSTGLTLPDWNEEAIQALTWQVLNLSMATNLIDARHIALRLIELQKHQHQQQPMATTDIL
ncbi:hypothetical protein BJ944DRAFT_272083 [Cunninghamella echinulata]|nr:hypothetical protein BJ944DRAFT_272083 [Cunninghamella echinulata]